MDRLSAVSSGEVGTGLFSRRLHLVGVLVARYFVNPVGSSVRPDVTTSSGSLARSVFVRDSLVAAVTMNSGSQFVCDSLGSDVSSVTTCTGSKGFTSPLAHCGSVWDSVGSDFTLKLTVLSAVIKVLTSSICNPVSLWHSWINLFKAHSMLLKNVMSSCIDEFWFYLLDKKWGLVCDMSYDTPLVIGFILDDWLSGLNTWGDVVYIKYAGFWCIW